MAEPNEETSIALLAARALAAKQTDMEDTALQSARRSTSEESIAQVDRLAWSRALKRRREEESAVREREKLRKAEQRDKLQKAELTIYEALGKNERERTRLEARLGLLQERMQRPPSIVMMEEEDAADGDMIPDGGDNVLGDDGLDEVSQRTTSRVASGSNTSRTSFDAETDERGALEDDTPDDDPIRQSLDAPSPSALGMEVDDTPGDATRQGLDVSESSHSAPDVEDDTPPSPHGSDVEDDTPASPSAPDVEDDTPSPAPAPGVEDDVPGDAARQGLNTPSPSTPGVEHATEYYTIRSNGKSHYKVNRLPSARMLVPKWNSLRSLESIPYSDTTISLGDLVRIRVHSMSETSEVAEICEIRDLGDGRKMICVRWYFSREKVRIEKCRNWKEWPKMKKRGHMGSTWRDVVMWDTIDDRLTKEEVDGLLIKGKVYDSANRWVCAASVKRVAWARHRDPEYGEAMDET